jgi:hypothetical protein
MLRGGSQRLGRFLETMSLPDGMVFGGRFRTVFSRVSLSGRALPARFGLISFEVLLIRVWSSDVQIRGGLPTDPKLRTSGFEKRVR